MITADLLRRWADRLCLLARGGRTETAQQLELASPLVHHKDHALVEPPPAGAARMRIFDDLATHTTLDFVDLELAPPGLTLADLQAQLGPGEPSVRVSPWSAHKQWFKIEVAGAPCTCDVFASFKDAPTATSRTTELMLRRNPSPARPR